jgi:dienelactone hydrolase
VAANTEVFNRLAPQSSRFTNTSDISSARRRGTKLFGQNTYLQNVIAQENHMQILPNTRVFAAVLVATGLLLAPRGAHAQSIDVTPPNPVLMGVPMTLQLVGFPPNTDIRIVAERAVQGWGAAKRMVNRAEAIYKTDASGAADVAKAAPISGSFKGADLRGLFWSMVPTMTEAGADARPGDVELTAYEDEKKIASRTIVFQAHAPDLIIDRSTPFPGALFATLPGTTKRPAIIVMGGSEGGKTVVNDAALRLASRGFAVLSLPYYSPPQWPTMKAEVPELPPAFADIDINRLNDARAHLQKRKEVDGTRIGLYGVSKGAEFTLLGAVHFPWVKSAVAVVPTDVVWEGWGPGVEAGKRSSFALKGKPFPFTPYKEFAEEFAGFQTGQDVRIRRPQDKGRAANPAAAAAARIAVERYKGPLMVIAGQEDQIWNSAMMAHNIAERRAAAKLETVSLIYTDAGHYLSGNGLSPTTQYNVGPNKSGGTPEANARAQADAWEKTISFLERTLAPSAAPTKK